MSVFSKKLINDLLKIAGEPGLKKQAQAINLSVLLKDKAKQLAQSIKPQRVSTRGGKVLEIKPQNLQNIHDFIDFIRLNEVEVDGRLVVVEGSKAGELGDKKDIILIERTSPKFILWDWQKGSPDNAYNAISKSRFEKLIKEIQDTSDNKALNVYLNPFLAKLNEASNEQLGKALTMADKSLLDGLDKKQLDLTSVVSDLDKDPSDAGVKIKEQDLADKSSLDRWSEANGITILDRSKGSKNEYMPAKNDTCGVVYLLNKRADALLAKKPDSISYKKYKQLLEKLASAIGCDLNKWNIVQAPSDKPGTTTEPGKSSDKSAPGTVVPGKTDESTDSKDKQDIQKQRQKSQLLHNVMVNLPFDSHNSIDITNVSMFVTAASSFFSQAGGDNFGVIPTLNNTQKQVANLKDKKDMVQAGLINIAGANEFINSFNLPNEKSATTLGMSREVNVLMLQVNSIIRVLYKFTTIPEHKQMLDSQQSYFNALQSRMATLQNELSMRRER